MTKWFVWIFALLLAAPIYASTWHGTTTVTTGNSLFRFAAADTTVNDSALFSVKSRSAVVCFDPDTGGVAGTGAVVVRKCPTSTKPAANPENSCISLGGANGNATLTGTEGAAEGTQNACIPVGTGYYFIDITTTCGGNACEVSVQGESQ